jgi:hypothetical protein
VVRSSNIEGLRRVATTLSPLFNAHSVTCRPRPVDAPVTGRIHQLRFPVSSRSELTEPNLRGGHFGILPEDLILGNRSTSTDGALLLPRNKSLRPWPKIRTPMNHRVLIFAACVLIAGESKPEVHSPPDWCFRPPL